MSRLVSPDEIAGALIGLLAAPLAFAKQESFVLRFVEDLKRALQHQLAAIADRVGIGGIRIDERLIELRHENSLRQMKKPPRNRVSIVGIMPNGANSYK